MNTAVRPSLRRVALFAGAASLYSLTLCVGTALWGVGDLPWYRGLGASLALYGGVALMAHLIFTRQATWLRFLASAFTAWALSYVLYGALTTVWAVNTQLPMSPREWGWVTLLTGTYLSQRIWSTFS